MGAERVGALLKVVNKIPLFSGLKAPHIKQLLSLCEFRTVAGGKVLFRAGDPSADMLILLSGRLRVISPDRVVLATIAPAAPVGEMGVITGQTRSATVETEDQCTLLVLKKSAFDRLMRSSAWICVQVYGHVIRTLAERLYASERQQSTAQTECAERRRMLTEAENRLAELQEEN